MLHQLLQLCQHGLQSGLSFYHTAQSLWKDDLTEVGVQFLQWTSWHIVVSHIHNPIKTNKLQKIQASHFHLENRVLLVFTSWFHIFGGCTYLQAGVHSVGQVHSLVGSWGCRQLQVMGQVWAALKQGCQGTDISSHTAELLKEPRPIPRCQIYQLLSSTGGRTLHHQIPSGQWNHSDVPLIICNFSPSFSKKMFISKKHSIFVDPTGLTERTSCFALTLLAQKLNLCLGQCWSFANAPLKWLVVNVRSVQ